LNIDGPLTISFIERLGNKTVRARTLSELTAAPQRDL